VGSKDFFDAASDGQVDGANALRSPGSTLKPFVYALALDRGVIGMNTLLEDVPTAYKDWAPVDFDKKWRGVVPARVALAESLNVPAVRLAERLEPDGLVRLLDRAGFRDFQGERAKQHGLATVLGGCDVTLLELTNLYAGLAQGGLHQPVRTMEVVEPVRSEARLFSDGAAYLVSEILTNVRRPELPDLWQDTTSLPRLAWKTGTSYGRRDAWSIGYNARWTVGVWVGNFDGRGVPELVGVEAAAPLLFSIARTLPGALTDPWIPRPSTVRQREVCALSGAPAGPSCEHRESELALENAPRARCALHVAMDVDDDTGERLCSRCREGRHYHREVHVSWPANVASWLRGTGVPVDRVPSHNPRCERGLSGIGPVIHAPVEGDQFVLRQGVGPEAQQIALMASVGGDAGQLYWFLDDRLVWSGAAGRKVMIDPEPGPHHLVAVDAEGRSSSVDIEVVAR
jgi:penicillin-binding protein 1C